MSYPLIFNQQQKQKQKQTQHLMMSPKMQQALQFLQLPLLELEQVIEQELEKNPILEVDEETLAEEANEAEPKEPEPEAEMAFDEHQFELLRQLDDEFRDHLAESGPYIPQYNIDQEKLRAYLENNLISTPSLYDQLMAESREAFSDSEDLIIAEILIGYIDDQGFITTPLEEIASFFSKKIKHIERVLKVIQTFDPIGIGSKNTQEALLIQLESKGKKNSVAYKLVKNHFNDLLHNRLPQIQKKLKISFDKLREIIETELGKLEFHPLASFSHTPAPTLIPDIVLRKDEERFVAEVNDKNMRPIRINRKYLRLLEDSTTPEETKKFIKEKLISAKWLLHNISQRGETLSNIANFIGNYQKSFFAAPDGQLIPLIMKSVAEELGLHESTIARAIANKYIDTPRGIFPFRHFFSKSYTDDKGGNISSKTVLQHIRDIINKEDKHYPLSDEAISEKIKSMGISCARRTVAKYRTQLKLGNAQQRRHY